MSTEKKYSMFSVLFSSHGMPVLVAAILGVALSIAIFFIAYSWERGVINDNFGSLANDRFHASENMFQETVKLLNFTDNVFLIGPAASSPNFTGYVRSLKKLLELDLSKGLQLHGLAWLPKVSLAEEADYEKAARATFDPKYQIRNSSDLAGKNADGEHADRFICYLTMGNTSLVDQSGKDMSLDPTIWKAMQQARDTGEAVAIPPIKMSADADGRLGYRVFQPLYTEDVKIAPKDRRQACTGFLCLDLDIGDLISKALKDVKPVGIAISVFDVTDGNRVLVFHHDPRLQTMKAPGNDASCGLEATASYDLFGRKLQIECRPAEAFWANRKIWQPWILLLGGLTLTITLAGYQLGNVLRMSLVEHVVSTRLDAIQKEAAMRQAAQ